MVDRRRKDVSWNVGETDGSITWERATVAVLMDIRDELKRLNSLLYCSNFTGIPTTLRSMNRKLAQQGKK